MEEREREQQPEHLGEERERENDGESVRWNGIENFKLYIISNVITPKIATLYTC